MNAVRLGMAFIAIGIGLLVAGVMEVANDDLLHIGGVGCIVFGAVAICVATEERNGNGQPKPAPRVKVAPKPKP